MPCACTWDDQQGAGHFLGLGLSQQRLSVVHSLRLVHWESTVIDSAPGLRFLGAE